MKVRSAQFIKSSASVADCPVADRPEYAFIGRSNVGKSSLINLLTGQGKLAKVSSKPGKTRLINHFMIDDRWYLVDLPGYGWAQVDKSTQAGWKKMIRTYFEQRENLTQVFILIDSRLPPQQNDVDFIHQLGMSGIPLALIFTKIDKQSQNKTEANIARFRKTLSNDWEELPIYFRSSVVTGAGKQELLTHIRDTNEQIGIHFGK